MLIRVFEKIRSLLHPALANLGNVARDLWLSRIQALQSVCEMSANRCWFPLRTCSHVYRPFLRGGIVCTHIVRYPAIGQLRLLYDQDRHRRRSRRDRLGKASCEQKSRPVLLLAILQLIVLTQPILVYAKVNHVLEGGPLEESSLCDAILFSWWVVDFLFL